MSQFREQDIEVSADLVRDCPGLSMDVGGSVAKIVYRTKQQWEALQKNKGAKSGKLRLLLCPRTELTGAIERIQADGYITRREDGQPTEIFTCGIGCSQFGPRINKLLNVKLSNVIEMDCFIKAFIYLVDRYSFKTLVHPVCQNVLDDCAKQWAEMKDAMEKFTQMSAMTLNTGETEEEKKAKEEEEKKEKVDLYSIDKPISQALGDEMYPCMLGMLGSAFGFMKVEKDGTFSIPDGSNRGGRTLLGLGALLLNAKSYDEIIDLAEKGNTFAVTTSQREFQKEIIGDPSETQNDAGTDVYAQFMNDDMPEQITFIFGNAVGKTLSDFSREDIASSLVEMSVNDSAQTLYKTCEGSGVRRCFISGSYTNREFIRERFTFTWEQAALQRKMLGNASEKIELHFLSQGSHLGALGALINNVENFIDKEGIADKGDKGKAEAAKEGESETTAM